MARATQNIEVTLDRQARDSIRSLVNAIDRLSDAIVNGDDVGTLAAEIEHVEVLRRLVEDVKARPASDPNAPPKFAQGGYVAGGLHVEIDQVGRNILKGMGK